MTLKLVNKIKNPRQRRQFDPLSRAGQKRVKLQIVVTTVTVTRVSSLKDSWVLLTKIEIGGLFGSSLGK